MQIVVRSPGNGAVLVRMLVVALREVVQDAGGIAPQLIGEKSKAAWELLDRLLQVSEAGCGFQVAGCRL